MTAKDPEYVLLDHTADLRVAFRGPDLRALFENAAKALMDLMLMGVSSETSAPVAISVAGDDLPDLMVRWLGEILYLLEGEGRVVISLEINRLSTTILDATVNTVPFDPAVHEIRNDIKAVTYHQIEVAEKGDHWEAKVIFDA
jgi:SHS2 domain-containing protein